MNYRNLLIGSVVTLAATANITFAREFEASLEPVGTISEKEAPLTSDLDGRREPVYKAIEIAQAMTTQGAKLPAQNNGTDGKTFTTRLQRIISRTSTSSRMLVIPKDSADAKGIAEVEEDLNVMAHILGKAVSGDADKSPRAMGIAVTPKAPPGSVAGPQNLFIEGYGALFFLNVNYPLVPPPVKEIEPEAKEKTSNEWEEARREISQPQRYAGGGYGGGAQGGDVFGVQNSFLPGANPYASGGNAPEYDAARVEELKKDLIAALKNTAHIRKLKSDETVTVVVTAPGTSVVTKTKTETSKGGRGPEESQVAVDNYQAAWDTFQNTYWDTRTSGPSTKLIFRARKSDAEAFQSGKLSFDEFRKKVAVILY